MFASQKGLKMLSESIKWHSNRTFHTMPRYFAQMYTIHSYFPPRTYDKEHPNRVWVKRMIPCVWNFMKRRRTEDYVKLLKILIKEAQKLGYILKLSQAMIYFELAAKKAYEKVSIRIVVHQNVCHQSDTQSEHNETVTQSETLISD